MFYTSCKPGNRVSDVFGDVENVFGQLFENKKSGASGFQPAWDIAEHSDTFVATFELPGIKPEDVKVEFEDGVLTVSGAKHVERSEEGVNFHRSGRQSGEFNRAVEFSTPVEVDGIDASFDLGLLTIRIPKAAKAVARKIEVKSS